MEAVVARLEAVASRLESVASRGGGGGGGGGSHEETKVHATVTAYDEFFTQHVTPFVQTCHKIKEIESLATQTETAFSFLRTVIEAQAECKKPSQTDLMKFIDPIFQIVSKAQNPDNRSPVFNFLKSYSEMIQCMNWILAPAPVTTIEATLEAGDFYMIKIQTAAKGLTNADDQANHRAFVTQMKALIHALADYTKQNFKQGLIWNPKGKNLSEFKSSSKGSSAPSNIPPPPPMGNIPPPPPPPTGVIEDTSSAPVSKGGGMSAVFDEINRKGGTTGATSGLKKVTADMKSKNLKDKPVLEPTAKSTSTSHHVVAKKEEKKPASTELKLGTWQVQNYHDAQVELKDVLMKQNILIADCNNTVISVPDKCKTIQITNCTKTKVVFNQVVSTFEVVNCKKVELHLQDICPVVTVDKTSGCSIWFHPVAAANPPNIITSNISEVNVVIAGKTEQDDPVEMPLPEQYLTVYKDGKLQTEPVSHKG